MIDPKNRREIFLKAIATGSESPVKPLTREEILLAEHARREASGGTGGSSGGNAGVLHFVITQGYNGETDSNYCNWHKGSYEEVDAALNDPNGANTLVLGGAYTGAYRVFTTIEAFRVASGMAEDCIYMYFPDGYGYKVYPDGRMEDVTPG